MKISFKHVLLGVLKNLPKSSAWCRDDSFPTRVHVVDKKTGEILPQKFVTEPQFTFHHMNAYEQKESENNVRLMVDISSYDSSKFDINTLAFKRGLNFKDFH
jgi:carotenoid cleavage dioxygenase-like enzyme